MSTDAKTVVHMRLYWWSRSQAQKLLGAGHLGFKLGAILIGAVLAFLLFARGEYRVAAETTLEPLIQQAAVAPFNGYIREAPVRAGDIVKLGVLLVALDDRELKLERLKHLSEQEEQLKQYRQAMAEHNAAQVQIVGAQLEQAGRRSSAWRISCCVRASLHRSTVSWYPVI